MIDKKQVMYDIERCICHVPDACKDCSHYTGTVGFECMENLMSDTITLLKEQEAVEPVKLVRCKNCKHCDSERIDKNMIWCKIHQFGRPDDYYCADGIEK